MHVGQHGGRPGADCTPHRERAPDRGERPITHSGRHPPPRHPPLVSEGPCRSAQGSTCRRIALLSGRTLPWGKHPLTSGRPRTTSSQTSARPRVRPRDRARIETMRGGGTRRQNHDHDNRMGLGGQHGRRGFPLVVQPRTNFLTRLARIVAGRRTPAARAAHPLRGDTHALTGRLAPVVGLGAQGAYAVGRLLHGLQCSAGRDAILAGGEGIGFSGAEFGRKVVPGPVGRRSIPGRRPLHFAGGGRGRGRGRRCLRGRRDGRCHGRTRLRRGAATPRGQDADEHRRCGPLRANHGKHDSTRMPG